MNNLAAIEKWVEKTSWIDFLPKTKEIRSNTSVCLKITHEKVAALSKEDQEKFIKKLCSSLEAEKVAFDIAGYRDAPPGIRIWAGSTIETSDLELLFPWIEWAFAKEIAG